MPAPNIPVLSAPPCRLLVLEATGQETETNFQARARAHPVIAIAAYQSGGDLIVSPVIVCDGDMMTLEQARQRVWSETTVDEVVQCSWPEHCDNAILGPILDRLSDEAINRIRERSTGTIPMDEDGDEGGDEDTPPHPEYGTTQPLPPPFFGDN